MHLKTLQIQGFKTFAERTQIHFTPGITCVIGPNGSGKSNIADAVLWVLGENNVRELRGATSSDVIFSGNDRRRALGMAEVSLTLDNSSRVLPLDFSEITVTRRLYRSGESECSINKVACRLRDIYELFLDTGVGRDAYSLIGQGEIDQILSVRSEDRRAVFEEAAGIKKYRVRRREAERKLEHTAQNLLRVNDIVAELESQLGPLQRQAAAAMKYREYATRLATLERAFYGSRLRRLSTEREALGKLVRGLTEERHRLEEALAEAQSQETTAAEAVETLDEQAGKTRERGAEAVHRRAQAESERARAEERAGEADRRSEALRDELQRLEARLQQQEADLKTARDSEAQIGGELEGLRTSVATLQTEARTAAGRQEAAARDVESRRQAWLEQTRKHAERQSRLAAAEARQQALSQQAARSQEALEDAEAEQQRLTRERDSFTASVEQHRAALAERQAAVQAATTRLTQAEQTLRDSRSASEAARQKMTSLRARLQALEELDRRGEGSAEGARRLLAAAAKGELPGKWSRLIDGLIVPEGLEKAVEGGLGVYADAVICADTSAADAGLAYLRRHNAVAVILPGKGSTYVPDEHSLAAYLTGEEIAMTWAHWLLGDVRLVDTLRWFPDQGLHITREGAWRRPSGPSTPGPVGAQGDAVALLARRRELERLRSELPPLEASASTTQAAVQEAETKARSAQTEARQHQATASTAQAELAAQSREAARRNGDLERLQQRVNRLRAEAHNSQAERTRAANALEAARAEQSAAGAPTTGAEKDDPILQEARAALATSETERRAADTALSDARVRLAALEQRHSAASNEARRIEESRVETATRRSAVIREQAALAVEVAQRGATLVSLAAVIKNAEGEASDARAALAALAEERSVRQAALQQARAGAHDLGSRLRELMERSHRADLEMTALEAECKRLGQQWLDAAASAHSLEAEQAEAEEAEEDAPLSREVVELSVESLMASWSAAEAERVLGSYGDAEAEIGRLRRQIRNLGAVNPDAVEQYAAVQERYGFLTTQRADLEAAREKLEGAIQEIDQASRETFLEAFKKIAEAFDRMFKKLFGGGVTELKLTDPADVLETGIEVIVQPPGKKQQNLLLLSGGERALTAMAMLFALLEIRPSPFCVLDEVDAPLDDTNVGRFIEVLREFTGQTQFIVVTHNRGTMEGADTLYGVTMPERGISSILSCTLADPLVTELSAAA